MSAIQHVVSIGDHAAVTQMYAESHLSPWSPRDVWIRVRRVAFLHVYTSARSRMLAFGPQLSASASVRAHAVQTCEQGDGDHDCFAWKDSSSAGMSTRIVIAMSRVLHGHMSTLRAYTCRHTETRGERGNQRRHVARGRAELYTCRGVEETT